MQIQYYAAKVFLFSQTLKQHKYVVTSHDSLTNTQERRQTDV